MARLPIFSLVVPIVLLAAVVVSLQHDDFGWLDTCWMQRKDNPYSTHIRSRILLDLCTRGSLLVLLAWAVFVTPSAASTVALASAWFTLSHWIVTGLKTALADGACGSGHANSVSGHVNYYVFTVAAATWIIQRHQGFEHVVTKVIYAALSASSAVDLWRTYFYGFHSARQMILGLLFAVINLVIFCRTADMLELSGRARWKRTLMVVTVFSVSAVAAVWGTGVAALPAVLTWMTLPTTLLALVVPAYVDMRSSSRH